MTAKKLNLLLMGKTGQGKSATGNTLLNRRRFKTSSNVTSETKEVTSSFALFGPYELLVVDGPGLEDTAMNKAQDKITVAKNMDIALAMCYGGVDAFLFVMKFGNKFTMEDKQALNALKKIFGDNFISHVIVVMTCGDMFVGSMEEQGGIISFPEWCTQQEDEVFLELYEQCHGRFVLFNNRETREFKKHIQIQEIVNKAEQLQKCHGRYTSQCFENARNQRERLILELRAPELQETIQKHVSLLAAEIEDLAKQPSDEVMVRIHTRIYELKCEIDREDKGHGVLQKLRNIVDQVEDNLNDVNKLIELAKELEATRQAKAKWGWIGTICAVVAGGLALAALPAAAVATGVVAVASGVATAAAGVGAVASGVGAVSSGVSALVSKFNYTDLGSKEKEIEEKQKETEAKRNKN